MDDAGCCPRVVDFNANNPVVPGKEPVENGLPSVTEAIHTGPNENVGYFAPGMWSLTN
jgi:hypothetical protein